MGQHSHKKCCLLNKKSPKLGGGGFVFSLLKWDAIWHCIFMAVLHTFRWIVRWINGCVEVAIRQCSSKKKEKTDVVAMVNGETTEKLSKSDLRMSASFVNKLTAYC